MYRSSICLLMYLSALSLVAAEDLKQSEQQRIEVIRRISPAVVCVMDAAGAEIGRAHV